MSSNYVGNKIESLFTDINKTITTPNYNNLKEIKVKDNMITLDFNKSTLNFIINNSNIYVVDENNKRIPFKFDSDKKNFYLITQPILN
ncbi:hypothetical protein [Caloramator sp. mosi_1]|uniref:hypothetical protein n=1 Tax=Caloramator sp. mosi_1 TaxID=3023090 RepID=UPI003081623C